MKPFVGAAVPGRPEAFNGASRINIALMNFLTGGLGFSPYKSQTVIALKVLRRLM